MIRFSSTQPEDLGAVKFVLAHYDWRYRGEGNAKIAISLPAVNSIFYWHIGKYYTLFCTLIVFHFLF